MTFNELENEIDDFIHYYNNVRTQENFNWMTSTQYRTTCNRKTSNLTFVQISCPCLL